MRRVVLVSIISFYLLSFFLNPLSIKAESSFPIIKVKLVNYIGNQSSISVTYNGEYQLTNGKTIPNGTSTKITATNGLVKMVSNKDQSVIDESTTIAVSPNQPNNSLSINGRSYNGSFQFITEKDSENNNLYVRPINEVDIETYLRGVVPQEMPALWSMEALKAQAIAARTYALKHKSDKDMVDTIAKQVYGGSTAYHTRSDAAIKETEGIVLKYNNTYIDALFSASNGGKTESNSNVWGGTALPYFTIVEDTFDYNPSNKTKFPWSIQLKQQQLDPTLDVLKGETWWNNQLEVDVTNPVLVNIKNWMKTQGYTDNAKNIKIMSIPQLQLNLSNLSTGGRVLKGSATIEYVKKDMVNNKVVVSKRTLQLSEVAASKIRAMVGISYMRSYLVDISTVKNGEILIQGRGNGHGVGLSQYGARNRADAGQNYKQILQYYYPNTQLVKDYSSTVASSTEKETAPVPDSTGTKDTNTNTNTSSTDSGTKTSEATKNSSQPATATKPATNSVVKDKIAPTISSFKTNIDYKSNTAKLSMKINKTGKVSIVIKDSKGKAISTISKNKSVKSGTLSYNWNIANVGNGTYTAEIIAENTNSIKKTVKYKITIKKPVKEEKGYVNASVLNVREKPTTSSKVINKLKKKQNVVIISKQGSWYKVKVNNKTGYVYSKYITKTK